MLRHSLLPAAGCLLGLTQVALAQSPPSRFDPAYRDIGTLHEALASKRVSCGVLVKHYLDRIAQYDRQGPALHALIRLNAGALGQAQVLDATRARTDITESPLFCIPFVVKDNIDVKGEPTTAGSVALSVNLPTDDADIVRRLTAAGAILIGKTNMSEMAASYGKLGYSSLGGLTLNPYNLNRNASGSSSGSAAAVAADFAVFALGTDTSGSSRAPASVTGVVGIRPSTGLLSREGIVPSTASFDTPGIMGRSAADVGLVLKVISGSKAAAPSAKGSLRGVRLGVFPDFRGGNAEVDAVEDRARERLRAQGATLVAVTLPATFLTLWNAVLSPASEAEFKQEFERYLAARTGQIPKSLGQFISRSEAFRDSAQPVNPKLIDALKAANRDGLKESPAYRDIVERAVPALKAELKRIFDDNDLSALLFSTMSCPASARFDRADPSYECHLEDPYAAGYIASVTGAPEVSLPAGVVEARVPVGLSLLGRAGDDTALLALASAVAAAMTPVPPPVLAR